jgi:hypothetical protein
MVKVVRKINNVKYFDADGVFDKEESQQTLHWCFYNYYHINCLMLINNIKNRPMTKQIS